MSYFLSPALAQLRDEINKRWPNRDKRSDGWIGDAAHNARKSDHNPDYSDGGIVRAIDVDKDGVDMNAIVTEIIDDPRTWYVIWQGRIRYGTHVTGVPQGWKTYTGANKHNLHMHVSVRKVGNHDRNAAPWGVNVKRPTPPKPKPPTNTPAWKRAENLSNLTTAQVRALEAGLQRRFPAYVDLYVDGKWRENTYKAVKEFQSRSGLVDDGVVGRLTTRELAKYGIHL